MNSKFGRNEDMSFKERVNRFFNSPAACTPATRFYMPARIYSSAGDPLVEMMKARTAAAK